MAVSTQAAPNEGFERMAAVLCHGSLVLGVPLVMPLAVWLLYPMFKGPSSYVRQQALQALVFHLFAVAVTAAFLAVAMALGLGTAMMAVLQAATSGGPISAESLTPIMNMVLLISLWSLFLAWASVIELIATVKALRGKPYELPIVKGWVR